MNENIEQIAEEMTIETVASNLRNTIKGKEQLVAHYREVAANQGTPGNINFVMATFVQDNIDELKRILGDVEQCIGVEDRAVPILSADEQALFAGIASSKLFTIAGAKKHFGVEE